MFEVTRTTVEFASHDGSSTIVGLVWEPNATDAPVGIVQLVHGMSEHVGRYDEFARFLAASGYVVCGSDHVGHGMSAAPADRGHMPAENGKDVLIADVHTLRTLISERFPNLPYVIFGHSMGSFVTRAYLARHGAGLAGAVICGTGNQPRLLSKAGNVLARLLSALKGERAMSNVLHSLADGAFSKAIPNRRTNFDWLSTNPAVVDAYIADELSGARFTVGAYATLTALTSEVVTPACAARVPKELPVLVIAGAQDPVGECGKGPRAAAELLRSAGVQSVDLIIYAGMRHEILNEPDKRRVYNDVLTWLRERA